MGILTRSRPASARVEPTLAHVERRDQAMDLEPGWMGLAMLSGAAGGTSPQMAENLATVVACVNAIASGLATLPATVYRSQDGGRVEAPNHPVARLLRAPNPHQHWPDFAEFMLAQALLRGNALAVVERDGAGRPTALTPIPWGCVQVQVLPSGRLAYDVVLTAAPYGGSAISRRYLEGEVLHLRDRSDDGIVGRSRLSRAPAVLDAAMGLQGYSSSVWQNAASPSGVLTLPPGITAEGRRRAEVFFEGRMAGAHNAKRILFADKDSTFTPISVSPEDAEVLDSRRFSVIELCRLFNVPPPIVQDYSNSTFTNASQASDWFAQNTLAPWCRKIEAEFTRSVFTDPAFHIEVSLSGLMRGSYTDRWAANVAAVSAGILTRDEVRAQEGYGPLPDAETESEAAQAA